MHRLPLQKPAVGPSPPQNDLNAGAQFLVTPDSDPHQPPSFHSAAQGHLALGSENVDANLSRDSYSDGGNNYVLSKPAPNNKSLPSQATQSISIPRTPSLQIYTDLPSIHTTAPLSNGPCEADTPIRASSLSSSLPRRTPSIRTALAAAHSCAGSISPNSAFSSPQLAALVDITPLPSPTFLRSSSWKSATSKSPSRTPSPSPISGSTFSIRRIGLSERPRSSSDRQQAQPNSEFQLPEPEEAPEAIRQNMHARNRSLSDYKPDTLHVPLSHKAALLHNHTTALAQDMATRNNMHREDYLAVQRPLVIAEGLYLQHPYYCNTRNPKVPAESKFFYQQAIHLSHRRVLDSVIRSTTWLLGRRNKPYIIQIPKGKMEPSIPDVGRRVATVSDMIQWLWHDGFYRGEVGWSAEWDPGAIFGTPNSTSGAYVFGVSTLCGEKAGRPLHLEPNVDKISDVAVEGAANAGFPETLFGDAHAKYVKTMIRQHKKLLPDALQEIDQRLLKAGVSTEEVTSLTNGRATDAYKKLARLDQENGG
ncbi:conserved hypothetical protein [Histoplasma capsulatum H143]|uniref:Uncharacterized protein n=1 Tax=Ajellomyces capsulatus (strain H143) TaxID=544712 RepID=C6HKF0_AJECH|nr:conserved hypothetical protein [Histoplasma capsulatum H143]